jgi:hypothetical protein
MIGKSRPLSSSNASLVVYSAMRKSSATPDTPRTSRRGRLYKLSLLNLCEPYLCTRASSNSQSRRDTGTGIVLPVPFLTLLIRVVIIKFFEGKVSFT